MWALKNTTPYAAERNWTRDKDASTVWIVAVKATFDIAPSGALKLADEQPPPELAPVHHGDPATTSLKYESDLLAVKPGTDVLLNASAHAPGGRPATHVDVLLRMDNVSKHLVVHGERTYLTGVDGGLTTTPSRPFTTCPIVYEDAFGFPRNPTHVRTELSLAWISRPREGAPISAGAAGVARFAAVLRARLVGSSRQRPLSPDAEGANFAVLVSASVEAEARLWRHAERPAPTRAQEAPRDVDECSS